MKAFVWGMEGWYFLLTSYDKTVLYPVIKCTETIKITLKEHSRNKTRIFQKQGAGNERWDPENEEPMPQQATAEAWSFS